LRYSQVPASVCHPIYISGKAGREEIRERRGGGRGDQMGHGKYHFIYLSQPAA